MNAADCVIVQKGLRAEDSSALVHFPQVRYVGDALVDFSDSAAVLDRCDLVVTVDTSIAHLAGALGKPVWLLVPANPDWRWQLERDDTPWYPSMRLFRQTVAGNWTAVMARVERALPSFALASSNA